MDTRVKYNRTIFVLSLLGMILALHISVQEARDFDHGCWGVGKLAVGDGVACRAAALNSVRSIFGVPIAFLGYFLYLFVATTSICKASKPDIYIKIHILAQVILSIAFPYAAYLAYYQFYIAKAYCPLCLISSTFVALLFGLHLLQTLRLRNGGSYSSAVDTAFISYTAFLFCGSTLGFLIMVDKVGFGEISNGQETERLVGQSLSKFIDEKYLREMAPCGYDSSLKIDRNYWVTEDSPILGRRGGTSVVAFLDPNCPHCEYAYAVLKRLVARFPGQIECFVQPRQLWPYSKLQVTALEYSKTIGKYYEMWDLQFEKRREHGLVKSEVASLFNDIGADTENLWTRLEKIGITVELRQKEAKKIGVIRTPMIYINGVGISSLDLNEVCLTRLVQESFGK